jgi:uncharacterized protein
LAEPRVWVLLGRKAGDNTQVRALAGELGWTVTEKNIVARSWEIVPHLLLGPNLVGINRAASSPLNPPWPDLVISAGRRNEPVAQWIRARSGGQCQLVHMGRPWSAPEKYQLVISTPQYFLEPGPEVLMNRLPLHNFQPDSLTVNGTEFEAEHSSLPRPWTTVLVGGNSGKYVFTEDTGRQLGRQIQELQGKYGGSVLLSNSARTPVPTWLALLNEISAPHFAYDCCLPAEDNPYRGMLACADRFVVTGESMSMLGEACAMGKPVHIYDPASSHSSRFSPHAFGVKPLSHRLAMLLAPKRMRRDVGRIQTSLIDAGLANILGEKEVLPAAAKRFGNPELKISADRVRDLF